MIWSLIHALHRTPRPWSGNPCTTPTPFSSQAQIQLTIFAVRCFRHVRSVEPTSQAAHDWSGVTLQSVVLTQMSSAARHHLDYSKTTRPEWEGATHLYTLQPVMDPPLGIET